MFRIWIKLIKENHLVKDITVCDDSSDTRTHKVMNAIDKACYEMDLSKPVSYTHLTLPTILLV